MPGEADRMRAFEEACAVDRKLQINELSERIRRFDEMEANGLQTARPIAAFHRTLVEDGGMEEVYAGNITFMYAKKLLFGGRP